MIAEEYLSNYPDIWVSTQMCSNSLRSSLSPRMKAFVLATGHFSIKQRLIEQSAMFVDGIDGLMERRGLFTELLILRRVV